MDSCSPPELIVSLYVSAGSIDWERRAYTNQGAPIDRRGLQAGSVAHAAVSIRPQQ